MKPKLLKLFSLLLIISHMIILYFWLFDWEVLNTDIGIIGWLISILIGIGLYFYSRKSDETETSPILKKILIVSTGFTAFLAVLALLITIITDSMP